MTDRKYNRKKPAADESTLVYGKVPPQAKEAEEVVLGAIMIEKRAFDVVAATLTAETFYVDAHQEIFRAMLRLVSKGQPIDMVTVCQELTAAGVLEGMGGPFFITNLTNNVVSSAHIQAHAQIIREKYRKREAIRIAGEALAAAYREDTEADDVLAEMEYSVRRLTGEGVDAEIRHIGEVTVGVVQDIEHLRHRPGDLSGVNTGYQSLNRITYGWQATDLIILAARPGVGKTAFALNLARMAALGAPGIAPQVGVGFFSLEMSDKQLVQRVLAAESKMFLGDIRRGRLDDGQMKHLHTNGIQRVGRLPVWIVEQAGLNILRLCALGRRMVGKLGVGLLVVDYVQLVDGTTPDKRGQNREQEIGNITRSLKKLAKELQVPIIALSQLSREFDKAGSGKDGGAKRSPRLSDLRESGSIEQDADAVLFLHNLEGRTMLDIAKHRNGEVGDSLPFKFIGAEQRFEEYEEVHTPFQTLAPSAPGNWSLIGSRSPDQDINDVFK
jgi:replicative DNA helicase